MKALQIGYGRAVLGSMANSGPFTNIGQNQQPFNNALFARISCNTFLEFLKYADQLWIVFVAGA